MADSSMKEKQNQERRNKPHGNYSTKGAKKSRGVAKARAGGLLLYDMVHSLVISSFGTDS
jgi:hypothetical protein